MTTEQNKAVIRRLNDEFWNKGNVSVVDDVVAADFVDHDTPGKAPGREGLKQFIIPFRDAFSDIQSTVEDLIGEGDKITWRWTFRGTHSGPVMGIPATGKVITLTGITIDRIAGGQIVERWNQMDAMGMLQQLGVIPAPEQA